MAQVLVWQLNLLVTTESVLIMTRDVMVEKIAGMEVTKKDVRETLSNEKILRVGIKNKD